MKFTGMMLSGALLLHIAVTFGEFYSTEGKANPEKRAMANPMLGPKDAAQLLYKNIRQASTDKPGQIGFLYLHGNWPVISYGNDNLKKAIKNKILVTKLEPKRGRRPAFWPINPEQTNLLIALPDKKVGQEVNNHGHSEHKMLEQLEEVREGFALRYRFDEQCPRYVILGTALNPCYDNGTPRRFGCAQDYVEARETFKRSCANTQFYLYVPHPKLDTFWLDIVALMGTNIGILTGD